MKLFIDECLSPKLAQRLNALAHVAVHPRDYGRTGERDDQVLARCLAEDMTIVTENAIDFRKLVAREYVHPGLIILPSVSRERSEALLIAAVAYLEGLGRAEDVIVNHVLEVHETGEMELYPLP